MAPKTKAELIDEETRQKLRQYSLPSRLKGAPTHHFSALGELGQQQHLRIGSVCNAITEAAELYATTSPEFEKLNRLSNDLYNDVRLNPYTNEMALEDREVERIQMYIPYRYDEKGLVLDFKDRTEKMINRYFHAIDWEEFRSASLFTLLKEIIPATTVVSLTAETYRSQRWLYDETAQRAAETLAYRLQYGSLKQGLPDSVPTDALGEAVVGGQTIIEAITQRLRAGVDVRRWLKSTARK